MGKGNNMNPAILAIIGLILTIVMGIVLDVNCGIVAVICSFILVQFFIPEMSLVDVYKSGWPTDTMFMMLSIMFLFGIAQANGALEMIAKTIIRATRSKNKIMPFTFYLLALIIAGAGAGPGIASIILPIAMTVCIQTGIKPYIMGVSVVSGAISGGLFITSVSGVVANSLAQAVGVTNYMQIYIPYLIAMFLEVVIVYLCFGGLKIKNSGVIDTSEKLSLNAAQKKTLVVIFIVLIGILFFGLDVGMAAFTGGAILIIMKVTNEKKAISSINWNSLLLVCGVAMLIYIVKMTGGLDLITKVLVGLINENNGTAIMVLSGGLLSSVSSSIGVAMPTLIPTTADISNSLGGTVSISALVAGVVAGANGVIYCPLSTLGALTLAAVPPEVDKKKYFNMMLFTGISSVLFLALLGYLGWFELFI